MSRDIRIAALEAIGDESRRSQQTTNLFDERINAFLGINGTDGRCLDIISRHGTISAGHLANEAGLTTGAVTTVIDRLELVGYALRVRDQLDRRKIWVQCTPHLNELVQTIYGVYDLLGPIMMDHFTDEQLAGILAFLKIGTRVNAELAEAISENTRPGAPPDARLEQARLFRRAVDGIAPRLAEDLARLAPQRD